MAPTAILRKLVVRTSVLLLLLSFAFLLMAPHASAYSDGLPTKAFQPDQVVAEGDPDLPSGFTGGGRADLGLEFLSSVKVLVGVLLQAGLVGL